MGWWEAILLGIVQGITEFLPISSSGHLVLFQHFLDLPDQGAARLFFDGMLHLGTLIAVLLYFGRELKTQVDSVMYGIPNRTGRYVWPSSRLHLMHLFALIAFATIPAGLVALVANNEIKESFKAPDMVAANFFILGLVLILADQVPRGTTVGPMTRWWQVLLIGVAQGCSAVFRGLSRSGMTIAVSRLVGLERDWAVRFSFLMSVVASLGLAFLGLRDALRDPLRHIWMTSEFIFLTGLGTLVSAVVGYLMIGPLIRIICRCKLWWFAAYVWIVGACVLIGGNDLKAFIKSLMY